MPANVNHQIGRHTLTLSLWRFIRKEAPHGCNLEKQHQTISN
ncbi:hypothetical protein HNQ57_003562 [Zhongshania antarctica]|uniref:Uncharacterized protein n=1 Tax=Zhongshania antarctica TaxID=641702 RepID=A0A840R7G7_9GAMM|nr:hypothetical protein [Zhongshania antarctica]